MLRAAVTELDFSSHGGQQIALGNDVAYLRNVFQNDRFIGEQRSSHCGQSGVLRAANAHRADQRVTAADYKFVHEAKSRDILRGQANQKQTLIVVLSISCRKRGVNRPRNGGQDPAERFSRSTRSTCSRPNSDAASGWLPQVCRPWLSAGCRPAASRPRGPRTAARRSKPRGNCWSARREMLPLQDASNIEGWPAIA